MKRNTFFSLFFISCFLSLFGQTNQDQITDSILNAFKSYKLDKAKRFINNLENESLQKVFRSYWNYNQYGDFDPEFLEINTGNFSSKSNTIYSFIKAEYYNTYDVYSDSHLAYSNYINSLNEAKQNEDIVLTTTILPRLLKLLYSLHYTNFDELKEYSEKYELFLKDRVDTYWNFHYRIVVKLAYYEQTERKSEVPKIDFQKLHNYAGDDFYLQGEAYQLEGIYNNYFIYNIQKAELYFKEAIENYEKGYFYSSQQRISGNRMNLGIVLFNQERYEEAIPVFIKTTKENKYEEERLAFLKEKFEANNWLYICHKKLNDEAKALYYLEKKDSIKEIINKTKLAIAVKKEEIKQKAKFQNKELKKEIMNLTAILGIVLLIAIALFYYFKKYKSKSKTLESEQSETLQKIDELKQIVIKNHIILKDKTKVYISDLMYIKAEDHYLWIYTNDTKKAFVRGKLNQIKEELPPNFIQSHRSYIINSNYIKQINNNHIILLDKTEIPLSRSHKNNFKDKP